MIAVDTRGKGLFEWNGSVAPTKDIVVEHEHGAFRVLCTLYFIKNPGYKRIVCERVDGVQVA